MGNKTVHPKSGLQGEIKVPGDKSITHRAIMFGSIAQGATVVENFLAGEDCLCTISAFRQLGVNIEQKGSTLFIGGKGFYGLREAEDVINLGNSGTSMRLMSGILAGTPFFSVLTGDSSLRRRPMNRVVKPLSEMEGRIYGRQYSDGIKKQNEVFAPMAIMGRKLTGAKINLSVASAQLKSSLIFAGLFANGWTNIIEPSLSRNHTELMLPAFSGDIFIEKLSYRIQGGQSLVGTDIKVCGDFSSAAFFIVGALITKDSDLTIRGVGVNPTRIGLLTVLEKMGAKIDIRNVKTLKGEKVADIHVKSSALKGIEVSGDVIPCMIDEFPVFCVAAARAEGKTVIKGIRELRFKESDRISTMCKELSKLGVRVDESEDGMAIEGTDRFLGGEFNTYQDHRVAMSMAVAALVGTGDSQIIEQECIETSFPGFWKLLSNVCTP